MGYSIITWVEIHWDDEVYVVTKPKIGGQFVDENITDKEKCVLTPFVVDDYDTNTNVWSYSMDKKTLVIDKVNTEWGHNKGAFHATQYHPTSVKGQTTARANCTTFSGTYTLSNPEDKGSTKILNIYKEICWRHMIIHGMWDVLSILDPFDTTKFWDLFHHTACFTLLTIVSHMEELCKTGDKHTIDNFDWSG